MKRFTRIVSVVLALMILATTPVVSAGVAAAADDGYTAAADVGDVNLSSSSSLGEMLSDTFDAQTEESENGNHISEVVIDGNRAQVRVQTVTNARVIVSVYDETSGKMLGSGMTEIVPEDRLAEIELNIDAMPAYFDVKAFLVDADTNVPLCRQYDCDIYTSKMQAFFAKTTDDFDAERVVNLDADKQNNFLVYNSETVVIDGSSGSNVLAEADAERKKYVIKNIDATITSLRQGDVLSYPQDGDMLIVKVASMEISGTTATIYGGELELKDVFDYVRIDASKSADEASVDNSRLGEGVRYLGADDDLGKASAPTGADGAEKEVTAGRGLKYEVLEREGENYEISGTAGFKCESEATCYYDANLFEDDELEVSFAVKPEVYFDVTLELSNMDDDSDVDNDNDIKFTLGRFGYAIVPGVYVEFTPSIVVQGKVTIEVKGALTGQIGKKFKDGKFSDNSEDFHFSSEFKVEGELFVGLSMKPRFKMIGDAVTAEAEARAGILLSAKLQYGGDAADSEEEIHDCISCLEGELDVVVELSAEVVLFASERFSWEADFFKYKRKLKDLYYSYTTGKYGLTTCPNHRYRQTICLLDEALSPIANAKVNEAYTDENGQAALFFTKGEHKVTIKSGAFSRMFTLTVDDPKKTTYILSENEIWEQGGAVISSSEAGGIEVGNCGNGVMYTYDGKGFLVISGEGDMFGYDFNDHAPWYSFSNEVTSVNIREGVTGIGENAFAFFENLERISIAQSVREIGRNAFCGCSKLQSVSLPPQLKKIGEGAFSECDNLKQITLYNALTSIGFSAFAYCDKLETVAIPDSVTDFGSNVFADCVNLKNVTIGNGVIKLEDTFANCERLETVRIGKSVVKIGTETFSGCKNLKNIHVADGSEDYCEINGSLYTRDKSVLVKYASGRPEASFRIPDGVERIAAYAFNKSEKLKSVVFPNSIREIGYYAFNECINLVNAEIGKNLERIADRAFYDCSSLVSITLPERMERIGMYAFSGCDSLAQISLPDSDVVIRSGAFGGCAYCRNEDNWENGALYIGKHLIGVSWEVAGQYAIKDGTISVGDYAFEWCENLTDVIIPDTVTMIGRYAFRGCKSLESAVIPYRVTTIGEGAFSGCERLATANLPDSVTSIEASAYFNTAYYNQKSNWENGALYIGKHLICVEHCPSETYNVKSGTLTIADDAFLSDSAPRSVYIPESVKTIGQDVFYNGGHYLEIKIAAGNANYRTADGIIYNKDRTELLRYDPQRIDMAFTVPSGVKTIGSGAFFGCEDLISVTIANDVTTISSFAFVDCDYLMTVNIGKSVKKIGSAVFGYSSSLTDIYYEGSVADWNRISLIDEASRDFNYPIRHATIHYHSSPDHPYLYGSVGAKVEEKPSKRSAAEPVGASVLEDTLSRSGLVPGSEALLMIVRGREDDFEISDASLLYIAQTTVGTDGTAVFDNQKEFLDQDFVVLIFGQCSHASVCKRSGSGFVLTVCDGCGEVLREIDGMIGDVNLDGIININDATEVQKFLAEMTAFSDEQLFLADTDGDGDVTINDATQLQKYLAEYDVILG